MKIIISPAKKMRVDTDFLAPQQLPAFLHQAEVLKDYLQMLPYGKLKHLLQCNDKIAGLNYERYQTMDLTHHLTPAILAFDGIQYQYMAPQVFKESAFHYIEKHLRILSGFYGLLRPLDGVVPYRLEMQAKPDFCGNLYAYWKDLPAKKLLENETVIVNLASKEYSRVVEKYLPKGVSYVTCIFGQLINGKIIEKGVYVKMARGEMVRFLAENNITNVKDIPHFNGLGYTFRPELSTKESYVFIK